MSEAESLVHETTGICTYLAQGSTWFHLKTLAVKPIVAGGPGLFKEGPQGYADIFSNIPGTINTDRPESLLNFLAFLRGREKTLAKCAARDVADRSLGAAPQKAMTSLNNTDHRVQRSILAELMYRSLRLARAGILVPRVALESTLEETLTTAKNALVDLRPTMESVKRLRATPADLAR